MKLFYPLCNLYNKWIKKEGTISRINTKKEIFIMKKRWSFLLLSIAIFALAGCSQKKNPDANVETEFSTTQESTTVSVSTEQTTPTETTKDNPSNQTIPAETNEKNKESISTESSDTVTNTWDGYEDNFAVETDTAAAYTKLIKEAVAEKDIEKLADLTSFPVYVGLSKENPVIYTREEFIAIDANLLFSEEMITSIAGADETTLKPSRAGFTLHGPNGMPSITFGVQNGKLGISGINY